MIFDKPEVLLRDKCERLEKQLAERDAALARCVEALWSANETLWNNALNDAARKLEKVIASLPTSAQATAKVLVAARELCKFTTYEPDGSWPELNRLREAIREEQEGK